ncbi:B12-binding domain-containing radical SAM protein [Candidatus Woesearchaeota archaeon]|nr:B12-binding domain-containing radical SAM protein [Candidatus Woesearchaeota archaeon]
MKKKILFVIPPSSLNLYSKSKIKAAVSEIPYISMAALAASLLQDNNQVQILDLSVERDDHLKLLKKAVIRFSPDYVGITFTTPLYKEALTIAEKVKEMNNQIILVGGGVHPSALPEETLKESCFDILVVGEGDRTIVELVNAKDISEVSGICYKEKNGHIVRTNSRELISDLDELPYPAWHLYNLKKYKSSGLTSKKNPVGAIETSRGCVFGCTYCNKDIFGRRFRFKSPERVVDEIEYMFKLGFKEIHIWDDNFVTNINRAKKICDLIIKRKIKVPWCLACGVRVDCIDKEFLIKAKKAGCYSIYFGVETGNEEIHRRINKGIHIDQITKAFAMAKKAKLETVGFFMFGLPGETEETMKETIELARKLDPDYAKVTILVPFPSTPIYEEMCEKGLIKTKDWSKYNFHTASGVYNHENLSWQTLDKYYNLFYRKFYFRPSYIIKRASKDLLSGRIFLDIYYFIKTWII